MSDQTRHSDTRPISGIIIIESSDDATKTGLLNRIRELVAGDKDVFAASPASPSRRNDLSKMMTELLAQPVLMELPPRRRKRKWRNPDKKGRR